nr:glycosyl hydrolase [Kibdelosporangium sp. MJ126-NF4]
MAEEIGRRRIIGAAAGAIALGVAGGITLANQQWFGPEETAEQETKPITADLSATSDAQALLKWFRDLPTRNALRVVSGQQIDDITAASYDKFVESLVKRTGKYPAMIGAMVRDNWTRSDSMVLIDHWRRGGLITMDIHPTNPWNPAGGVNSAWVPDPKAKKPDLRNLLLTSDSSPQRNVWRAQLERLGDLVEELNTAGVVVLLRPLHEGNGSWFWWGQDMPSRKTFARDLYRDIFFYISETRRLHNVLWVYSPGASWDGPALSYYPGSEYVDMVCPSRYDDDMLMLGDRKGQSPYNDYKDILTTGKPLGFGECGPETKRDGTWDARSIIKRIRENYPAMTYFNCWHGWENKIVELAKVQFTEDLMNDPWVISRDKVDWRAYTTPTTSRPSTTSRPPTTPPKTQQNPVVRPQITR